MEVPAAHCPLPPRSRQSDGHEEEDKAAPARMQFFASCKNSMPFGDDEVEPWAEEVEEVEVA